MSFTIFLGILLITIAAVFNILFFALQRTFEYPDILRKPTSYILTQFHAGGQRLITLWYLFMLSALALIPAALLFQAVFISVNPILAQASAIIGVIAGLVQVIGLIRWSFLVPLLARRYVESTTTEASRASIETTFEAFHQYIGVALGEHIGYIFTSLWTILIAILMFNTPTFGAALAILGIVAALGIFVGVLEQAGWKAASAINAIAYILWSLWLILSGIALIFAVNG